MKHLLTLALVLNGLLEALAAATLIGGPTGLGTAGTPATGWWAMHYGFAVIAIASAGVWLWPRRRELAALTAVLGVLATFHGAVLTSLVLAGDQPQGVVAHAVLFALFVVLLVQRAKLAAP